MDVMTPAKTTEAATAAGTSPTGPPGKTDVDRRVVELDVTGMTCASCVSRVQRVLGREEGVVEAVVNLVTGRATVDVAGDGVASERLVAVVERLGYGARSVDPPDRARPPRSPRSRRRRRTSGSDGCGGSPSPCR